MQCWTNVEWVWRWALIAALAVGWRVGVAASDMPQLRVTQQGVSLLLDAEIPLTMPQETEAILRRGVPLVVVQEVKILQSRWYWQDSVMAHVRREWTLSYQALTQRWRVMLRQGDQVEQFDSAAHAWTFLTHIQAWPIGEVTQLGALRDAQAELRWTMDRRMAEPPTVVPGGDAGAAWRLSTIGRTSIPNTTAPVRDALGTREAGS